MGVQKTVLAIIDSESENIRPLFLDLAESTSIPTAIFVSNSSEYFFGKSAILAAIGGYEGLLFTHFADDLSLIDHCAVPETGTNAQQLTNKFLMDSMLRHIITLLGNPALRIQNRIQATQSLHLYVTAGHLLDKNSSFYDYHSDLTQNMPNGVQISFVNVQKNFSIFSTINSVVGVHLGKLSKTDIKTSDVKCLGSLCSVRTVIKTFLQYVYNERRSKTPQNIVSYDLLTLDDLIEKLEIVSAKQNGKTQRIAVLVDGKEEIIALRQSDKDYFDHQMPIDLGNICVKGFVQVRNAVYSYIERSLMPQERILIVPDEYGVLFKYTDICSENDILLLMSTEYRREQEILKNAINSVETFKRAIRVSLALHYQCKKAFQGNSEKIKNNIIVPTVRVWGARKANQSLQQLSDDIDRQVRVGFHSSVHGGRIESAILQLKESEKIYIGVETCMNSCLAGVFDHERIDRKDIGDLFAIIDRHFNDWQLAIPQSQSIMPYIVRAKGFFDFSNDNMPINISKRSAISNRFLMNMDSYCTNYFRTFDADMHDALSKQIFAPLINDLTDYVTERYEHCLEEIVASSHQ